MIKIIKQAIGRVIHEQSHANALTDPITDVWALQKPSLPARFAMAISDFASALYEFGASGPKAYLDITGFNDEFSFTTKKHGLVGAIEIQGQYQMVEPEAFRQMVDTLELRWQSLLSQRGVTLDFVFLGGDKKLIHKQLSDAIAPNVATSRRFELGLESVLESKVDKLSEYCAYEKAFLCVWVDPSVLSGAELKSANQSLAKEGANAPFSASHSIDLNGVARQVESIHLTALRQIATDLNAVGIVNDLVTCSRMLRELRLMIEPNNTDYQWQPSLPGQYRPTKKAHRGKLDVSHLFPPSLDTQLFPNGVGENADTARIISIGNKLHSGVIVTRPCLTPTNFQELFDGLQQAAIPFRIRIMLQGDGLSGTTLSLKSTLAKLFSWTDSTGTSNRAINSSLKYLRSYREDNGAIVGLSLVAETWIETRNSDAEHIRKQSEQLNMQVEKLTKVIQSWGSMDTKQISGDPLFTSMSTMPALTRAMPGEIA
ncbi:MAG: hypothetical protein AAF197_06065, partial [Pseudomonadota bacterium]